VAPGRRRAGARDGRHPAHRPAEYRLAETPGDHLTLIDPASPDWATVIRALPELAG
jgi:hypothetical protein